MTCDLWPVTCDLPSHEAKLALTDQLPLIFYLKACAEITCPPYGNCVHSDNGEVCLCPNCSPNGGKVCGSDGRTYNHSCELEKHAYPTVCAEKTCPPYANCIHSDSGLVCLCPNCAPKGSKVCGSDGRTYEHSCELEKHACKKNKSISIVSQGGCEGMLETIHVDNISIQLSIPQRHTNFIP